VLLKPSESTIVSLLRSRGLRPTRAGRLILARLRQSNDHLSADQVRRELRRRGHKVSIATLYQNLRRLAESGLLVSFADSDGVVRFDANSAPHAHLVCTNCNCIADLPLDDPLVRQLELTPPRGARRWRGWSVRNARLEFSGLCPRCR